MVFLDFISLKQFNTYGDSCHKTYPFDRKAIVSLMDYSDNRMVEGMRPWKDIEVNIHIYTYCRIFFNITRSLIILKNNSRIFVPKYLEK